MPVRFRLIGMTFLLSMLLYVDRVAISTARNPVTSELGLSDTQFGWILSAFALGYALFQVPSGVLADRLGPRVVLSTDRHVVVDLHRSHWRRLELRELVGGAVPVRRRRGGRVSGLRARVLQLAARVGARPGAGRQFFRVAPRGSVRAPRRRVARDGRGMEICIPDSRRHRRALGAGLVVVVPRHA